MVEQEGSAFETFWMYNVVPLGQNLVGNVLFDKINNTETSENIWNIQKHRVNCATALYYLNVKNRFAPNREFEERNIRIKNLRGRFEISENTGANALIFRVHGSILKSYGPTCIIYNLRGK